MNMPTQEQRYQAREQAKAFIVSLSRKPVRSDYADLGYSKYPPSFMAGVIIGCVLMFVASLVPSAIRVFDLSERLSYSTIADQHSALFIGIATVIFSEIGSILFTLALAVLPQNTYMRKVMIASVFACALVAISGNYEVVIYQRAHVTVFTYLEALLPPFLTLATAYILKEVALDFMARRYETDQAYKQALAAYEQAVANPEKHDDFLSCYANSLWDMFLKCNKRATQRYQALLLYSNQQKYEVVKAIMAADSWYLPQLESGETADAVNSPLVETIQEISTP